MNNGGKQAGQHILLIQGVPLLLIDTQGHDVEGLENVGGVDGVVVGVGLHVAFLHQVRELLQHRSWDLKSGEQVVDLEELKTQHSEDPSPQHCFEMKGVEGTGVSVALQVGLGDLGGDRRLLLGCISASRDRLPHPRRGGPHLRPAQPRAPALVRRLHVVGGLPQGTGWGLLGLDDLVHCGGDLLLNGSLHHTRRGLVGSSGSAEQQGPQLLVHQRRRLFPALRRGHPEPLLHLVLHKSVLRLVLLPDGDIVQLVAHDDLVTPLHLVLHGGRELFKHLDLAEDFHHAVDRGAEGQARAGLPGPLAAPLGLAQHQHQPQQPQQPQQGQRLILGIAKLETERDQDHSGVDELPRVTKIGKAIGNEANGDFHHECAKENGVDNFSGCDCFVGEMLRNCQKQNDEYRVRAHQRVHKHLKGAILLQ
mmetsp:Transcript_67507/g.154777  ORF Transcript_67507/g.154777 Transcript_67507/m.154777 type:complete len:421 (+) Transcript_67507:797-2059(+)